LGFFIYLRTRLPSQKGRRDTREKKQERERERERERKNKEALQLWSKKTPFRK